MAKSLFPKTKPKQAPKPKKPSFKLYVIQHKETNKFYTENGERINNGYRREQYTDDLKRVRVFRTKSGAKASRGFSRTIEEKQRAVRIVRQMRRQFNNAYDMKKTMDKYGFLVKRDAIISNM